MRVAILTGIRSGLASRCLPTLVETEGVDVVSIVYCEGHYKSRWKKLRRDLKKMRRIGIPGALIGIRMRRYYAGPPAEDLFDLAERLGLTVDVTPRTNARETTELLRKADADLGLSLGNSYIASRVFSVPRHGMLNVHGEVLPRFQGAASVVWAIHEGIAETGFTIHEVGKGIDTGRILYQERFPIVFRPSFAETVSHNVAEITRRIPAALARVVADYDTFLARARVQEGGRSYTTPTFRQFLHMRRQFRRMQREAR